MSSVASLSERLRQAASAGHEDQVRELCHLGAKMDADMEGRTALHLAAANGHLTAAKALVEAGAKVNVRDVAGYSPLHQAATEGHEEIVKFLLKNGCNVDTQDELHGNTALHEAAWKGFSRTVEVLCKHGANVYIKNNGGFTPLHLTCQNGHNQSCRVLLLSACKPDVRNSYGDTSLHTAARYGHAGVLRILISAFCCVSETNKNGDTALHIAAAMGRRKLTRILLEAGCDQSISNNQSERALDIAERKGFSEVVEILTNPPMSLIPVGKHEKQPKKTTKTSLKKREKESGTSQESTSKDKKEKHKKSKKGHKVHFLSDGAQKGNVSPYGCHMYPSLEYFPSVKLKSLPSEPLKTGEQYYADLAGNIKKGPRGLGYMCYCAPFFHHVEKKMDANKQELLNHIDNKNEDLKAKITHLEKRTHDQLFNLNQKMKESLALERTECSERMDRRVLRERYELEDKQRSCAESLRSELKSWIESYNGLSGRHHDFSKPTYSKYPPKISTSGLARSKSEDLLSDADTYHTSTVVQDEKIRERSSCLGNGHIYHEYRRGQHMNPDICGTKPKYQEPRTLIQVSQPKPMWNAHAGLKRDSRSEGDLTSCYTAKSDNSFSDLPDFNHVTQYKDKLKYDYVEKNIEQTRRSTDGENESNVQVWNAQGNRNVTGNEVQKTTTQSGNEDHHNRSPKFRTKANHQMRVEEYYGTKAVAPTEHNHRSAGAANSSSLHTISSVQQQWRDENLHSAHGTRSMGNTSSSVYTPVDVKCDTYKEPRLPDVRKGGPSFV